MFRFCDSFDHYLTANVQQKWTNGTFIVSTAGRHGSAAAGNFNFSKTLDYQSHWVTGFAANNIGGLSGVNAYTLQALTTAGSLQNLVFVVINADKSLSVTTPAGTIGNTPAFDWSGWHYVELMVDLSGNGTNTMTATCTLRVDTETLITGSLSVGVLGNTIYGTLAKANVHNYSPSVSGFIDDLYINDGQLSTIGTVTNTNTGFFGDVKIGVIYPNGDHTVQWTATGSSTTTHFVNVNELTPDDDTSYVFSTATGSLELFDWQHINSFVGTIKAVQYLVYARKDDEGARAITLVEGTAGTNTLTNPTTGKTILYLNDTYDYHHVPLDSCPQAGAAWTPTNFNADAFGFVVATNT